MQPPPPTPPDLGINTVHGDYIDAQIQPIEAAEYQQMTNRGPTDNTQMTNRRLNISTKNQKPKSWEYLKANPITSTFGLGSP